MNRNTEKKEENKRNPNPAVCLLAINKSANPLVNTHETPSSMQKELAGNSATLCTSTPFIQTVIGSIINKTAIMSRNFFTKALQ